MCKQVVNNLVSINFGSLRHGHIIKQTFMKYQTVDSEICSISFFQGKV